MTTDTDAQVNARAAYDKAIRKAKVEALREAAEICVTDNAVWDWHECARAIRTYATKLEVGDE